MKKVILLILCILTVSGCTKKETATARPSGGTQTVKDVLNQSTASPVYTGDPTLHTVKTVKDDRTIEVDLVGLSQTMIYSQVSDMMYTPQNYLGKIVRMEGIYTPFYDSKTKKTYHNCLIPDATACCAQGIEFILKEGKYPQEGEIITVVGKFVMYSEGPATFVTLKDAVFVEQE